MKLSKAEEQLMELVWSNGRTFLKELVDAHPEPKPASSTVATLLKRMQDKGFIGYKVYGNSREYYALVERKAYFSSYVKELVTNYFDDSPLNFASFFTTTSNLSPSELESLKKIIDQQIEKSKKS